MNSKVSRRSKTGYKGITWVEKDKKYVCLIQAAGGKRFYKRCKTIDEAIVIIRELRIKYHGEFARHE